METKRKGLFVSNPSDFKRPVQPDYLLIFTDNITGYSLSTCGHEDAISEETRRGLIAQGFILNPDTRVYEKKEPIYETLPVWSLKQKKFYQRKYGID